MLLAIINDQGNCVENMSNFVDSAMFAAGLTPLGAKPPAGQAITKCLMRSARDQHDGLERRLWHHGHHWMLCNYNAYFHILVHFRQLIKDFLFEWIQLETPSFIFWLPCRPFYCNTTKVCMLHPCIRECCIILDKHAFYRIEQYWNNALCWYANPYNPYAFLNALSPHGMAT